MPSQQGCRDPPHTSTLRQVARSQTRPASHTPPLQHTRPLDPQSLRCSQRKSWQTNPVSHELPEQHASLRPPQAARRVQVPE